MLELLKKINFTVGATLEQKKNDIIIKSKDRISAKSKVEDFLNKKKIPYTSVFKKSKSASLDVLVSGKYNIIFKPIIAKGAGGVKFERDFENSLNQWISSEPITKYQDIIYELSKYVSVHDVMSVVSTGKMNQKRNLTVSGKNIQISDSDGKTLSDIILKTPKGDVYLSLKMSATYYVISASIFTYMKDPKTRDDVYEFFGLDGEEMGGFGAEYFSSTTKQVSSATVVRNLTNLFQSIYGSGYIMIHQNGYSINVADFRQGVKVRINSVEGYVYPKAGARKYANIKTTATIDGKQYKIDWQFRGTTAADVGPKYMRVLVKT